SRNVLAELQKLNGYLGSKNLSLSRSKFGLETDRVETRSARSRSIWPIEVASGLKAWSLPSAPAMKLKLPKVNSMLGTKVIALKLIGAIKPVKMISTTAPTWRA